MSENKFLATGILCELSKADIRELQQFADAKAIQILVERKVDTPENLVVREGFPLTDVAFASEEWIEDYATRAVPPAAANAFANIDAGMPIQVPADRRSHVYFGIKNLNALPMTTQIQYLLGAAAVPTQIKDRWHIEKLYTTLEQEGYTEHPITYEPAEFYSIQQYINRIANDHIVYMLRVGEKKGETFMAVTKS